jgi:5-methylcytosine-specific restriction protein A
MDHVVPLTRGGCSEKNNLVACCKECNTKKKSMLPQEWQEYMDSLEKD